MIYQNVELHNVAEVRNMPEHGGVRLQRVPEEIRVQLEKAGPRALAPACAEIRFVTRNQHARVTLSCPEGEALAIPFYGLFQGRQQVRIGAEPVTVEMTGTEGLWDLDRSAWEHMPFSPRVFRLFLGGSPVVLQDLEGDEIRPPTAEELPSLRYLAYGTSITHGGAASYPHLCYVARTARCLGADLINLGMGGSAYCEKALADYIAARQDWHLATLALSVNMIGAEFDLDTFYERVSYMVDTVAGANTERPVACITIYPHFRDFPGIPPQPQLKGRPDEYRQRLRDAVAACPHPNVHLIEGEDILSDIGGLTCDLIHPGDDGMIRMGENLAARLKSLL